MSSTTAPGSNAPAIDGALKRPVVALDGPGSSGKSSVGAAAAVRLGLRFCDTGLLYRAVTFLALQNGVAPADEPALVRLVPSIYLGADASGRLATVTVDGVGVTAEMQNPNVDAAVSAYASVPALRIALLERQREIARAGGIVMAGRDIGTVVLPDATVKIYLDAGVEERAQRRGLERGVVPGSTEAADLLEQLRARDARDSGRPVAPLRAAPDAVVIRTDGIGFDETVEAVVAAIRGSAPAAGAAGAARRTRPMRHRKPVAPTPIAVRMTIVIRIVSFVLRWLVRFFTRVQFEGNLAAIPRTGAVLIAANHASNADPVLIGAFLNQRIWRPINWMGKREVFDWKGLSWLARQGGVHPVERGAADVEAFRTAMRILDEGQILAVFPEGTRSPDGRMQAAKDGVAVLAARSGAVVVPIGIRDSDRLWPKGRLLPRFTRGVTVKIGVPFTMADATAEQREWARQAGTTSAATSEAEAGGSHRRAKAAGTGLIMRRIAALLPERQRGAYGDPPPG